MCVGLVVRTHTQKTTDDGSNYDARTTRPTHTNQSDDDGRRFKFGRPHYKNHTHGVHQPCWMGILKTAADRVDPML